MAIEVCRLLETEAQNILEFMASNGLVANPSKTVFMMLNQKRKANESPMTIKVGETLITQEESTKLLGIQIEESQKWNLHLTQLTKTLNSRLFQIRRIKNQIPKGCIMKVVQSLWFSKLRYGLQLSAITRINIDDPMNGKMRELQYAENRLLRFLEGCRLKDRKSTSSLLLKFNLPSVNQLACEIKLLEAWKSQNIANYPISFNNIKKQEQERVLRQNNTKTLEESFRTKVAEISFHTSTARLWNQSNKSIKEAKSLYSAKKLLKLFAKVFLSKSNR